MTARHAIFFGLILVFSADALATDVDLPMIQINHDDDDEYPDLQEQVHLEDFFWTGSGDGPPDYVKKIHTGLSQGKDVIVKTNTVVATVYVDGHDEVDVPICLDCFPDNTIGLPLNFTSNDRRYWLLTVISGFYTTKDIPMLEEKLAKLYRLAFTRQQSKHLGIGNGSSTSGASVSFLPEPHNPQGGVIAEDTPDETDENSDDFGDYHEIKRRRRRKRRRRDLPPQNQPQREESSASELEESAEQEREERAHSAATDTPIEQPQLAYELLNPQNNKGDKGELLLRSRPAAGAGAGANLPPGLNPQAIFSDDHVRIVIHNITQMTEKDIQSGGDFGAGHNGGDVNTKMDERPLANQTEIIYSVLVGGRPVLAVTAANDMKLVSEQEVTSVMGKEIFMKAEPYLKEPQATPLAPATRGSESGFIASLGHSPILIIIGSIVIFLLLLLLIALLLMGRPRRESKSEVKRASSRNELLAEGQSPSHGHQTLHTVEESTTVSRRNITEGVHNFAFESETVHASIAGPQHPTTRARRDSTTSSDNTSDSSIYCPINPPPADVQRMLDEKAATLFDKRKRRQEHTDIQEAIYTSVISERKKDKKHSSAGKHKTKRRYLSENRVGSIEEAPNHSSTETTASNESIVEALQPNYQNLDRTEAFNPHNNYNRNKLLHSQTFTDRAYDTVPDEMPTQAINREIIRALQPSEKSSETGSIGSFLSMASVKSFPKQSHPEPLNRVLEPVFVTYYDDPTEVTPKPPRKHRTKQPLSEMVASIERFPEPKAPRSMRAASQSDNPDPGVVGPIVWEIHKKRLASENDDHGFDATRLTPIRDPAETRSHFEGLLEGAMQLYSSQDDLPTPLPTKNFTNQRKRTNRELRGKSAGSSDQPKSSAGPRPSTAQPDKTSASSNSTQPPSPNMGAWGSGGVHQPLVRPLSAGPFHRPDPPPSIDVTRVMASQSTNREDLSAAPLIEAIQNELKKFKRDA